MSFLDLALSLSISGLSIQFDESFSLQHHPKDDVAEKMIRQTESRALK
jgi:hypothetical protein